MVLVFRCRLYGIFALRDLCPWAFNGVPFVDASLYSFCCCNKFIKETDGKEDGVAKIETTTDELKPNSGERSEGQPCENPEPSPASETEEPLFKSSLRMQAQPKAKVSCRKLPNGRIDDRSVSY